MSSPEQPSGEASWRGVRLGVDDPEFEVLFAPPDAVARFEESRLPEVKEALNGLLDALSPLFWKLESIEYALRDVERRHPVMAEVRQHVRQALAGYDSDVLAGFDRANLAISRRLRNTPGPN